MVGEKCTSFCIIIICVCVYVLYTYIWKDFQVHYQSKLQYKFW